MNISTLLDGAARTFGDRPAISVGDDLKFTYRDLQMRTVKRAGGLAAVPGLRPGDRAVLAMSNRPIYLELLFSLWHAGLVVVPVNAKLHPKEVAYIVQDTEASLCFVTDDLADGIETAVAGIPSLKRVICVDHADFDKLLHEPIPQVWADRDDLAWIFYTSGTTGNPKGAMLTHQNLQLMAWSYLCDFDRLTEQDSMLHLGPQSHAAGLLALSHVAKASHQIMPASGGFEPSEIAALIDQNECVSFFGAPTMLKRLVENDSVRRCRIDNIRTIIGGAAPFFPSDVRNILNVFGSRFSNGYGQGECPCTISAMPKHLYSRDWDDESLISVGPARTGVEIKIVDQEGRPAPEGEVGEIAVRSDIVMEGYWRNPEATAKALVGGWLYTGDLGAMNSRGMLWLKDRSKDLIISGGSNIYPQEIEQVLLADPRVTEVAVVGKPDPEWGESVVAFVVRRPGSELTAAPLDKLCLDSLARFKRPKEYIFVDTLPRNQTGKVLKTELRSWIRDKI